MIIPLPVGVLEVGAGMVPRQGVDWNIIAMLQLNQKLFPVGSKTSCTTSQLTHSWWSQILHDVGGWIPWRMWITELQPSTLIYDLTAGRAGKPEHLL